MGYSFRRPGGRAWQEAFAITVGLTAASAHPHLANCCLDAA
jgi:hypothetical protein